MNRSSSSLSRPSDGEACARARCVRAALALCIGLLTFGCGGSDTDRHPPSIPREECNGVDDDVDGTTDEASCRLGNLIASASCEDATCRIVTCAPGWADCDAQYATGCERDTRFDAEHCGGCSPCPDGNVCADGACIPVEGFVTGGAGDQRATRLVQLSSGDFAMSGYFNDSIEFGDVVFSEPQVQHGFVWSFSTEMEHRWHSIASAMLAEYGTAIWASGLAPIADGGVYVSGGFAQNMTWGARSLSGETYPAARTGYLARLSAGGACTWLTRPESPISHSLEWTANDSIVALPGGPVVGGSWTKLVAFRGPPDGYVAVLSEAGTPIVQSWLGTNAVPSFIHADGEELIVGGWFRGDFWHARKRTWSVSGGIFVGRFSSTLTDVPPIVTRDVDSQVDGLSGMVALEGGGVAIAYYGENEGAIEAIDEATSRWRVPLSGSVAPTLLSREGRVYAIASVAEQPVKVGDRTLSATGTPLLLIVVLDALDGSVQRITRLNVGPLRLSSALIASDGRLWLAGAATGHIPGLDVSTMDDDIVLLSLDLGALH